MESPIFSRPTHICEKRKYLFRSTGSFSVIEDNIVAPTPRKVPNIACSPKFGRKSKPVEEALFGEAGFELQTILFQPQNTAPRARPLPISQVLIVGEDEHESDATARAPNPITLNSPFHLEERSTDREPSQSPARLYPAARIRGTGHPRKELNRARSLSWPGVPKMGIKRLEKVA